MTRYYFAVVAVVKVFVYATFFIIWLESVCTLS